MGYVDKIENVLVAAQCEPVTAPERLDRGIDLIVAPPSMEWTMAFDHEHYGPFWAVAR